LAAERFDAIAASMGAKTQARRLEQAWKHLLISQSHDVGLCEYSRWQGDRMAPLDRIEDYHNFTWGAIGYGHLEAAQKQGQEVLEASLGQVVSHIGSEAGKHGQLTVTVFNHCAWERTDLATTGRIYPIREKAKDIVVKDRAGRVVPSQIIKSERDKQGNLVVADLTFLAKNVPSVGYDTYYLEFAPETTHPAPTDLRISAPQLELENEFLNVKLSSKHGAIVSLVEKRTGREMLDGAKGAFPAFKGTPNQDYCLRSLFVQEKYHRKGTAIPALFDSAASEAAYEGAEKISAPSGEADWRTISKSAIRWIEQGPLRATVKTSHQWPLLKFETYVTLCAGLPWVEVTSRVLAEIPPAPDALGPDNRFPAEIKNGYWLNFAPGFQPASVVRDFPLGIEPTERQAFQARTFVDLVGKDGGLLVLHPGTQYFKRNSDALFSNLAMREWESYFTGEYGWPRYSEYRHVLLPHGGNFTNAERVRAAEAFSQKLVTVVGSPHGGSLPKRKGFIAVRPQSAHLMVLRAKEHHGFELRFVEVEGKQGSASVELAVPMTGVSETNLAGKKVAEVSSSAGKLNFQLQPCRLRTFEINL
jgi:alpha-mannosidase